MLVIFAYYASANTAGSRELRGSRGGKTGCGVARLRVGSLGDSWLVTCGQVIAVTVIFNQFTIHLYIYTYIHIYIYTYIHVCINVYVYIQQFGGLLHDMPRALHDSWQEA